MGSVCTKQSHSSARDYYFPGNMSPSSQASGAGPRGITKNAQMIKSNALHSQCKY